MLIAHERLRVKLWLSEHEVLLDARGDGVAQWHSDDALWWQHERLCGAAQLCEQTRHFFVMRVMMMGSRTMLVDVC